jgi:hypothetical protein
MRHLATVVSATTVALLAALQASATATVTDLKVESREDGALVVLTATEPLTFQSWQRTGPDAVVVDLLDTEAAPGIKEGAGPVQRVELTRHDARGQPLSRLTLPVAKGQEHEVTATGNTITIAVWGRGTRTIAASKAAPVKVASRDAFFGEGSMGRATATDAIPLAQSGGQRQMTYIGFKVAAGKSRVFARMNDKAEFTVRREGANLVVLEIKNATIPLRNNRNHLDTSQFANTSVKMITPSEIEDATPTIRIAIEMRESVPFETKVEGRDIAIYFQR